MANKMTKSALVAAVADQLGDGASKRDVAAVLDALTSVGHRELKKSRLFVFPGFAKFAVAKKPATPARQGVNPFTKQPITIAAKPASKKVRVRPVKAIKVAVS